MTRAETVSPHDIVRSGLCIGCGSCAADRSDARMAWDGYGQLKPKGPADWYRTPDATFSARCPFSPQAEDEDSIAARRFPAAPARDTALGSYEGAYVGHVADGAFRAEGSSGGMVSWVAAELLGSGRVDAVAHVAPQGDPDRDGFFAYRLSRSVAEIRGGAKSRYYPIELSGVIRAIRETPGRYAVVGVPCFIKAINLLRATDPVIAERVTHTLGLFCGHMKSARLVESFAWQLGKRIEQVQAVDYRIKDEGRPANWYRAHLELKDGGVAAQDWWHLVDGDWGAGFFQNSACNACDDVMAETADIAFGDAWVEPYSSDGRGTNVVVVRSPEMMAMVETARGDGRLALEGVDAAFIANTQAAGLRHRREGLAYRLSWMRFAGVRPRKRLRPGAGALPARRRLVYRTRYWIAKTSHRLFALARRVDRPPVYTRWAKAALTFYSGITWSHGRIGKLADRIEQRFRKG
ncbi:Coenzyme F420 hydrogenase/dehydrogenase, beta subunit C-terminal domain [Sphingomonas jatrophae]|uniref:Coenzyme F420-reducing hydrogenase, beta subunit n=1 Tax=Sphingomonas jatrophae TaxID=1166337 RepID=A0A1I6JGM4_9SPHN|nr:Coenzyme F420 hydrogenase/dehydrogenase, beta subunit C-terminal domain [Sphingomonas jatrophae]SFR77750.1 Coenzyme F420-reducing hydrogenase, beta subunit [Sphingomonas jatrophae]